MRRAGNLAFWAAALGALGCAGPPDPTRAADARAQPSSPRKVPGSGLPESLAPFVPTPMLVVQRMLELAGVTGDDVVYDLGCGDGRIVVEAARRYGARGVGVDYDKRRCEEALERARREGVADLVEIRHEDVLETDFSDATVVALYLLPDANAQLKSRLASLKAGARVVSHDFGIRGWKPVREETLVDRGLESHTIYLWIVGQPARR
jgi:SAM-dependent methyltransferase